MNLITNAREIPKLTKKTIIKLKQIIYALKIGLSMCESAYIISLFKKIVMSKLGTSDQNRKF